MNYKLFLALLLSSSICGCISKPTEEQASNQDNIKQILWTVDWHPHQDKIVVGGSQDSLSVLAIKDFQALEQFSYPGTITKAKWHPTKNKLAVSVQDGISWSSILDLDTKERVELDTITNDGARAIGWNPSGDVLAVGDYAGMLTFFNENGKVLKQVDTEQKGIIGLDWHPTEDLLVAIGEKISLYDYKKDSIWHINHREEEMEVLMLCVAWHPDGDIFVTGDYGHFEYNYPPLLQYWSRDGIKIKSIEASKAEYRNMKWSSNGALLATASEKIRLWDQTGRLVAESAVDGLLWGVDWNQNNTQIVTTDNQGKIIVWNRNLDRVSEF